MGIKVAIVGVGNCASSLVQGVAHYSNGGANEPIGLIHWDMAGSRPPAINIVAAWDVDSRHVGKDVSQALSARQTCVPVLCDNVPHPVPTVPLGSALHGAPDHLAAYTN